MLDASNHLYSIYIVFIAIYRTYIILGIMSNNFEMVSKSTGGLCRLYANMTPYYIMIWVSVDFGIHWLISDIYQLKWLSWGWGSTSRCLPLHGWQFVLCHQKSGEWKAHYLYCSMKFWHLYRSTVQFFIRLSTTA